MAKHKIGSINNAEIYLTDSDKEHYSPRRKRSQEIFEKSLIKKQNAAGSMFDGIRLIPCLVIFGFPLLTIYGLMTLDRFNWKTWLAAVLYYFWSGLGITAGYHRLWSHKAYSCSKLFEIWLMIGGSAALEGSIKWWCLTHRAHHRFTDTDHDPYNAKRGFFYSHLGWMLFDVIPVDKKKVIISDLKANKIIRWQNKNYSWFGPFCSVGIPMLIGYFLCDGDIHGGFFIIGILRNLFVHHATWCVNSVAHYFGEHTFDDTLSPRDSIVTSLITLGEGYHNFHHEFPNDYRNGIHWYDYDPTKWLVYTLEKFGLAWDLQYFPKNEIDKGKIDMAEQKIKHKKQFIDYGVGIHALPIWNENKLKLELNNDRYLLIISHIVYDVTDFLKNNRHPGGRAIILNRNGKDVTDDFNGNVYNHTNAARNLMSHFRVAKYIKDYTE